MNLRMATDAADLPVLRSLIREYAAGLGVNLNFQGFEEELAELPGKYVPPQGGLWLAEERREPAGCVALRPFSGDACEMKRLYVRPAFRRLGAGRLLAEQTIIAAINAGYRQMYLDTLPTLTAAITLYRDLGFQECAAYYHNPVPDVVYFIKDLHVPPVSRP